MSLALNQTRNTARPSLAAICPFSWFMLAMLLSALMLAIVPAAACGADELTPPAADAVPTELAKLIAALDAADFDDRAAAAERLGQLATQKELATALTAIIDKALMDRGTSFEVRTQLAAVLARLPATKRAAPPRLTAAQITALLDQLGDDSFAKREAAGEQLERAVAAGEQTFEVMPILKQRLSDPGLSTLERRHTRRLWERARETWLRSDPATWRLPDASDEQIASWVAVLGSTADGTLAAKIRRRSASRELNDLLAREAYLPRVKAALEKQLAATTDTAGIARLKKKLDLLRPAMVAEIWSGQQSVTIQHLLIDVPQIPEGAPRATHFDRIDDKGAHCVSGNTLRPGDYPVGVAVPHPEGREMMYHLINLATPRARLLYNYQAKHPDAERLLAISQRTVDRYLAEKQPLSEIEIMLMLQLDGGVCSRFAGPFFKLVPDQPIRRGEQRRTGQPTQHSAICFMLALMGTHEAVPALEAAIRDKQITEPVLESPYHIAWIAALAIAERDPWPGIDDWLAEKMAIEESLVVNVEPAPDLGATAAALLLKRHEEDTSPFSLQPDADSFIQRFGFVAYRFATPAKRAEVLRWWTKKKAEEAARRAS